MDKMTQEQTEIRAKRRAEEDLPVNGQGEDAEETLRQDGEEIDVDFVFSSLTDLDFHGLKTLLRQGFGSDAEALPLSAMAEALLAQQGIGTAVKVDDTLDPYAVMSVLVLSGVINTISIIYFMVVIVAHIKDQKTTPETIAVTDYLRTKATAHCADPEAFETVLKSPTTGLLVHDRLLNMPPQLAPPMIRMLMEEMAEVNIYLLSSILFCLTSSDDNLYYRTLNMRYKI